MAGRISEAVLILLIVSGAIDNLLSLFCVVRFGRKRKNIRWENPDVPVSVLKPARGLEPDFRENIESFCRQDYPEYEVLLGFAVEDDDAMQTARQIANAHSHVRIVITGKICGANRKVANLQGLLAEAKYPLVVMSDSDMRAGPQYLRTIVSEYREKKNTGMVTSLYAISEPTGVGAALESLSLAVDFIPSVLVARQVEGITFGLGASMLVSRKAIEETGGLAAVADYLADDYQIGNRLWKEGYGIVLSDYVMEDVVGAMKISDYLAHQIRWAKTYRASRPWGYFGYGVSHILPFSVLLLLVRGPETAVLAILASVLFMRFGLAVAVGTAVTVSKKWLQWLPLLPFKDFVSFLVWASSFTGRKVHWRVRRYLLQQGGRIKETGPAGAGGQPPPIS